MSGRPKLKVIDWSEGNPSSEEICDFEQAKGFFDYGSTLLIKVEGQVLIGYDELVRLADQAGYRNKEFLEVELVPLLGGG